MVGVKGVNRVSYSIGPDLFHKLHTRHVPAFTPPASEEHMCIVEHSFWTLESYIQYKIT